MKWNKDVLLKISAGQSTKEGLMFYKTNENDFKQKWFKLCSNLLFFYNTFVQRDSFVEPIGVFLMEQYRVYTHPNMPNKFTLYFIAEPEIKYSFFCMNSKQTTEWYEIFSALSFSNQRKYLESLRAQIKQINGIDPLQSTPWFSHTNTEN